MIGTGTNLNGHTYADMAGAHSVRVENNRAYVTAQTSSTITILDVSVPLSPVWLNTIPNGGTFTNLAGAGSLMAANNILYVAGQGANAVTIIDVTDTAYVAASGDGALNVIDLAPYARLDAGVFSSSVVNQLNI